MAAAILFGLALVLVSQRAALSALAGRLVPVWASWHGHQLTIGQTRAGLFAPCVFERVDFAGAGSRLSAGRVEVVWASPLRWLTAGPGRWIERITVEGLRGSLAFGPPPAKSAPDMAKRMAFVPRSVEVRAPGLAVTKGPLRLALENLRLALDEDRPGAFSAAAAGVVCAGWRKEWRDLRCDTAWREGTAYFSGLELGEGATVDSLSVAMAGPPAAALGARVFGGSLQAEYLRAADKTTVAVNSWSVPLEAAGRFLGLVEPMSGRLAAAKLTFHGDPARPLEAQMAARVELDGFAWGNRRFEQAKLGVSLAGRRLQVDEAVLRQSANTVETRGWLMIPPRAADWRRSAVQLDWRAEVRDLGLLAALAGEQWRESKGTLQAHGTLAGALSDGRGWLSLRGWNLQLRGVPVDWVEADATLAGREIAVRGVEAWSGRNFLRGSGRIAMGERPGYQGRLELRVNDIARYLEPLGRFAPDWAREGGVLLFWDGDGTAGAHSGVVSLELVRFAGDLNPVPVNATLAATYSPGNFYVSRFLLDRGPLSLSSVAYLSAKGLSVQDVQVFNGRTRLLRGEVFLPVSFPALLAGRPWPEAMLPGADVYVALRSEDLQLGPLIRLFGQDTPVEGRVDWVLDAAGAWQNPRVASRLSIDRLSADLPGLRIPASRLESSLLAADKRLDAEAALSAGGRRPATIKASLPVLGPAPGGGWSLLDRAAPADAELALDGLELSEFTPRGSGVAGRLRGTVRLAGSLSEPALDGAIELRGGRAALPVFLPETGELNGRAVFAGRAATLEDFTGRLGGGKFTVSGRLDFPEAAAPDASLDLSGEDLLLNKDPGFPVNGTAKLSLRVQGDAGSLTGEVRPTGGAWKKRLLVRPVLVPGDGGNSGQAPDAVPRFAAGRAGGWKLDVRVAGTAVLECATGNVTTETDLSLAGTLAAPVPSGTLRAAGLVAETPAAKLQLADTRLHFLPQQPWVPVLDASGQARVRDHDVRALAWGPLPERLLALESDPALPPASLVSLLDTGRIPAPAEAPPPGRPSYSLEVR